MKSEDTPFSVSSEGLQSCLVKVEMREKLATSDEGLGGPLEPLLRMDSVLYVERNGLARTSGRIWIVGDQYYITQTDTSRGRTVQMVM